MAREILKLNKKMDKTNYSFLLIVREFSFGSNYSPGKKPAITKERTVPYAMREGVVVEIRRIIPEGILEEAIQVDWVSL